MPDRVSEWKQAVQRTIGREVEGIQGMQGFDLPSGVLAGNNPDAAGEGTTDLGTVTGYDGTNTTLPFMRGFSFWDTDTWTA